MGRPGIRYEDVANAANQLKGQGKNPTIEAVRMILKTGSSSTINPYLRQWKESEDAALQKISKENLPAELVSLVQGLWARVIDQSSDILQTLQKDYTLLSAKYEALLQQMQEKNERITELQNQLDHHRDMTQGQRVLADQTHIETQEKNRQLLHEKWILMQENLRLENRLKQLQAV